MNLYIIKTKRTLLLFAMATIVNFTSCQPEDSFVDNGLTNTSVDASFTVTPVEGKVNTYKLVSQSKGILKSIWDAGAGEFIGKTEEEISLPDAGTYTIAHTVIGAGGAKNTETQEIVVTTSDPEKGNIVIGGTFATADDQAAWTKVIYTAPGDVIYSDKGATFSGTGGHVGIYQSIDVVKDREYTINMSINAGASTNMWFEVYAGKTDPTTVTGDYSVGGAVMGLNTWGGCGNTAVSGQLATVGCVKNARVDMVSNVVKYDYTGKAYLFIRSGGGFATGGISINRVEFRAK